MEREYSELKLLLDEALNYCTHILSVFYYLFPEFYILIRG